MNAKASDIGQMSEAPAPAGGSPEGVAVLKIADSIDPSMAIGGYMSSDHEYWWNGRGPVPSVTTILGILDKPAVGVFKAKEAARAVFRQLIQAEPGPLIPEAEEAAISWALKEADKARDQAAELGSSVHLLADLVGASENDSTGFGVSPDTFPYIEAYRGFLRRYNVSSIVSSEHMIWSLNGYGGTYDLIMSLPHSVGCGGETVCDHSPYARDLWLIDIKTSGKGPYPEWALQLAGYRWSDSIIILGDPRAYPMPEIQRTGVLHLRPDLYPDTGWRLIEYPTTYTQDYLAFLAALELWKWKKEGRFTKSRLMGRKR